MSALEVFDYAGAQVRTVLVDGEPWFVAADVTKILGFANGRMATSRLDADDVSQADIIDSLGRKQSASILNEPGLYELIIRSDKPEARSFRRWVTHDVLPQIRSTGKYAGQQHVEYQIPQSYAAALELAFLQAKELEEKELALAAAAPKVEAYDRLMDSDGYYPMDQVAKIVGLGRNTLYSKLRDLGVIMRGSTTPYQRHMHHFVLTASTYVDGNGVEHSRSTTRLRPSGLPFIMRKLGVDVTERAS